MPMSSITRFFYKKLGSGHSTKRFLINIDLLQVYFNFTKGNAKEEKLKTRRDGGKGRKEGGGENFVHFSTKSFLIGFLFLNA